MRKTFQHLALNTKQLEKTLRFFWQPRASKIVIFFTLWFDFFLLICFEKMDFFLKKIQKIFFEFFSKKIHFFKKINKKKSNPRYFCDSRFQCFTISSMASSVNKQLISSFSTSACWHVRWNREHILIISLVFRSWKGGMKSWALFFRKGLMLQKKGSYWGKIEGLTSRIVKSLCGSDFTSIWALF